MKLVDLIYGRLSLKKALLSGSDVILLKYKENDEELFDVLYKYVANKDAIENINKSVGRIIDIKKKYKISDYAYSSNLDISTFDLNISNFNNIFNL